MSVVARSATPRRRKRDLVTFGLGAWSAVVYIFLFLPIVYVIIYSFTKSDSFLVWGGRSLKGYRRLFDNEQLKHSIGNSLKVAVGATVLSVILGGLAGIALARRAGKWTKPFMLLVFLILVTPEIVDAIGYLTWFIKLAEWWSPFRWLFREGLSPLFIGHSLFSSAVVTMIVRARMAGLDESLEEAAADLYAPPSTAFRQITLPLVAPALLAGGLLSFTFSLDNTIVSQFVSGPNSATFPVYVFSSLHSVLRPDIGAAATLMFLVTLLALGLVALVLRRAGDTGSEIATTITGVG